MNENGASRAVLINNDIGQNGLSCISCDGYFVEIKGNRIFSNHYWGMMVKTRSSANILNNDIFENKCDGIRNDQNYTATVIIDGNTIRDHTGPGVYTVIQWIHQKFSLTSQISRTCQFFLCGERWNIKDIQDHR